MNAALNNFEPLRLQVLVPQDGYVTAYVGNESDVDVLFDDVQVEHRPGLQVQETQYDPAGLELARLAAPSPGIRGLNNYRFNGKEFQVDLGLAWNHQDWRFFDPQLLRWHSVDPLVEASQESWTPYQFGYDNAVRNNDPDGRICLPCVTGIVGAVAGLGYGAYKYGFSNGGWKKVLASTIAGGAAGFITGLGGSALISLGGVNGIGGANLAYLTLGTGVAAEVTSNLLEQGTNMLFDSNQGFDQQDFMISLTASVPLSAFGFATEPLKDAAKGPVKNAIIESMGKAANNQERKQFIRQEAKAIRQAFANAGGKVSNRNAKKAAGKIFNAAEASRQSNVNATILVGENGVSVGTTVVENIVSDKTKDQMKK